MKTYNAGERIETLDGYPSRRIFMSSIGEENRVEYVPEEAESMPDKKKELPPAGESRNEEILRLNARIRELEGGERSTKKINSLEGYEGKAAQKAEIVYGMLTDFQGGFTLKCLLKAVDLSKSTYMFHRKRILAGRNSEKELEEAVKAEFEASKGRYGVRRITAALHAKGYAVNHKAVQRIMRKLRLKGKRTKKMAKYRSYEGTVGKVADNLLNRQYRGDVPRKVFVTDVMEFNRGDIGGVYLSPVMDLYNREIIGYDIRHPDFGQVRRMVESSFARREIAEGALFHSEQGWQYQTKEFGDIFANLGITQSMSRKGNCHDNAVMENFFGRLKTEMFHGEEDTFRDYEDFRKKLEEYIDWYNRERIKEYLHWKSPCQVLSSSSTL